MAVGNAGLPRLSGGIAARERAAWAAPCRVHANRGEQRETAAVVETLNGPVPICADCIPQAEALGHTVRREPLAGYGRT
jgi:hypothetical protein